MRIPNILPLVVAYILLTGCHLCCSSPLILLHLQTPPHHLLHKKTPQNTQLEETINKINTKMPSKLSKKMLKETLLKNTTPHLGGFLATYGGYVTYSDAYGKIKFPLRHTPASKLYLLVAANRRLVAINRHTISHAEIAPDAYASSKLYVYEKQQDKHKHFFWNVRKETLPENARLSPLTFSILTKPKNIVIMPGDFLTQEDTHLVLPNNIYVTSNTGNVRILLKALDHAEYLEPIKQIIQRKKEMVQKLVENE